MRNIMLELLGILILCSSKRNASSRVEPWNPQLLINDLATVLNVVAYLITWLDRKTIHTNKCIYISLEMLYIQ